MSERMDSAENTEMHEMEAPHTFFIIEKMPDEHGVLEIGDVIRISADQPDTLRNRLRWSSEDSRVRELVIQRDDGVSVLVAQRDSAEQWQLTSVTSDVLKLLQTNVGKRQWSERWLFKTDQPKRKRSSDV